jgi:hypothetical protein
MQKALNSVELPPEVDAIPRRRMGSTVSDPASTLHR